jgi:hypothetical protein
MYKHVFVVTDPDRTIEGALFSMQCVLRLYTENLLYTSRQRGCPTSTNPKLSKKEIIKERIGKIGCGSQVGA